MNKFGRKLKRLQARYQVQDLETIQENTKEVIDRITQEDTKQSLQKMTSPLELDIDPLKFIERLPFFDGKSEEIFTFIEVVEDIVPIILKYDTSSQKLLLNRIKSKLRGKAREVIEINSHVKTWSEIKTVLVNNFGDKRSCFQIFDELRAVSFGVSSVEMYNQIKSILRRLNNKTKDQPNSEFNIKANNLTALNIFKDKLPEPMRSILFSRNPKDLEEALDILVEGNYAYYNPYKNKRNEYNHPKSYGDTRNYNRNNNKSGNKLNRSNDNNNNNPSGRSYHPNDNRSKNYNRQSQNGQNNNRNYVPNRFTNGSGNFRNNQNTQNQNIRNANNTNNRPEPMEVDVSTNSRVNTLESEPRVKENFPLEASETTFLI